MGYAKRTPKIRLSSEVVGSEQACRAGSKFVGVSGCLSSEVTPVEDVY